jgi:peptidoglycan/xylan/chitin deacetylase (PgdA/CDA1 family)
VRSARVREQRAASIRRRIRRPRPHWLLFAFLALATVVLLGVQGFATRTTQPSATPDGPVPDSPLAGAGPILYDGPDGPASRGRNPGRRIALTFDDGPDQRWTPRIAATLKRLGVPGTFFVVGSNVAREPAIVRDLHRDGFEIGNHTFTHANLAELPEWQRTLQLNLTENAITGATGVRARVMRPPYSAGPEAATPEQARAFADVAERGYVVALTDLDGRDWSRPGAEQIARNITPKGDQGGLVLLHDGGGDRSQTIEALEQAVPESCWLYFSLPMRSAWPIMLMSWTLAPLRRSAISSSFCWPLGRRSALSNSNSTSDDRLICSMTGGGGGVTSGVGSGAAAATGGGGATATGGGTGAETWRTASQGAAAFSGVQSVVFQHRP